MKGRGIAYKLVGSKRQAKLDAKEKAERGQDVEVQRRVQQLEEQVKFQQREIDERDARIQLMRMSLSSSGKKSMGQEGQPVISRAQAQVRHPNQIFNQGAQPRFDEDRGELDVDLFEDNTVVRR